MNNIDYLILGGGSAGCVLAARLSEDKSKTVVLVEAGRDLRPESIPSHVRARYPGLAYLDKSNVWPNLVAKISGASSSKAAQAERFYEQARVLGGGSVINAMVANRGSMDDYDEWGRAGAEGWNGDVALKYFKKLERDCDFTDEYHGTDGPIPVRRHTQRTTSQFVKSVCETLQTKGFRQKADQNGKWEDGIFPAAIATTDQGHRIPASLAYLTQEVRQRPNLRVITDTEVHRLLFEGTRVIGADIAPARCSVRSDEGSKQQLLANETIVCLGGIHSAALLMRSGIGDASELQRHGIAVKHNLPGVGKNLMEHPLIAVSAYLPKHSRLHDLNEHHDQALLRYTSKSISNAPEGDMHIAIIARTGWHAIGERLGTMLIWVNKSYSRGSVSLRSSDPREEPEVTFNLLSDNRDLKRLKEGFCLAARTLLDHRMDGVRGVVFPTSYSERVRRVSSPGKWNALQMKVFGKILDYAGICRDLVVHSVITGGLRIDRLLGNDAELTEFVASSVTGVWHASGTCRMGSKNDPMAVTDGAGRVFGVQGLRISDSSVMPTIPRANTNMPTLMLAERIADLIKGERTSTHNESAAVHHL